MFLPLFVRQQLQRFQQKKTPANSPATSAAKAKKSASERPAKIAKKSNNPSSSSQNATPNPTRASPSIGVEGSKSQPRLNNNSNALVSGSLL